MSIRKLTCILHLSDKSDDDVKPFDTVTWTKVKASDSACRTLFKNSKYFAIKLPDSYNKTT